MDSAAALLAADRSERRTSVMISGTDFVQALGGLGGGTLSGTGCCRTSGCCAADWCSARVSKDAGRGDRCQQLVKLQGGREPTVGVHGRALAPALDLADL